MPLSPISKSVFSSLPLCHFLWCVFFDVHIIMAIFCPSSHTDFSCDFKRISKCDDRFKVKSWEKKEQGLFFLPFYFYYFFNKNVFSKLFAPDFSGSKKKLKNVWLDVWRRYLLIIVCRHAQQNNMHVDYSILYSLLTLSEIGYY